MKQSSHWTRSLTVLSLCAAFVMACVAWRSASARSTELEMLAAVKPTAVAVVDLDRVIQGVKEFTDGMEYLKNQGKEDQTKIDQMLGQVEKLQKDLEAMKDSPTTERLKKTREWLVMGAQYDAFRGSSQQLLEVQGGELMRSVFEKMVKAADKLQTQDGWDMILFDDRKIVPPERLPDPKTGKEGGGGRPTMNEFRVILQRRQILSAVNRVDVTQQMIDLLNAEYGKAKK